ncbi:MAG: 50S ribosomal protein L3 [Planctomycetota bacterium]
MAVALLGRKVGMTQVYDESGVIHPVTVLSVGPCQVLQVRTAEKDGYSALQLGYDDKPERKVNAAERGHAAKANAKVKRLVREVRLQEAASEEPGAMITVEIFKDIKAVDVTGTMKGRGTAGVMKRHGFAGLETTHGVQRKHRAGGSIGCNTSPGRVLKGRKMSGNYGNTKSTVRNLAVVRVDTENNVLLVRGGVPGPNGGYIMVRQTNKVGR